MAPEPLFIDSGGFYALVSAESAAHADAVAIIEESQRTRRRAVTTDYKHFRIAGFNPLLLE